MRVYDRFTLGDLIEICVIDGRQYRSRQACYRPPNKGGAHLETNASCPERLDPGRTMLGFGQEAWLYAGLAHSKARWNLIAQDVLMAQLRRRQDGIDAFWTDDWNGYPANRVHFFDSRRRGYVLVDLSADAMQAQMRVVSDAHDPKATISTFKTFAVEGGRLGVVAA